MRRVYTVLANKIRHNAVAIRDRLNPKMTAKAWVEYIDTIIK